MEYNRVEAQMKNEFMYHNESRLKAHPFEPYDFIRASNSIEDISDLAEIEQSLFAWEYLSELRRPLTHLDIGIVQATITAHQPKLLTRERGHYRSELNPEVINVGGRDTPSPTLVPQLMDEWLENIPTTDPLESHIRFEVIHPFVDGNGRTGRMLYWHRCRELGIDPLFFSNYTETQRWLYYGLFPKELDKSLIVRSTA